MGPRLGKLIKVSSGREEHKSQMDNQNGGKTKGVPEEEQNPTVAANEKENSGVAGEETQQEAVESKYKNVDLRPEETQGAADRRSFAAVVASTSSSQPCTSASANANIMPCASTSLALSTVPKLSVVEKSSKKRRAFKSSTPSGKRDFFGMRRSKKWPMMKLSSCCSKKEQEVEPPAASSLSCICTGFRRRDADQEPPAPLPPIPTPEQFNRQVRHIGGVVPIIDLSLFNPADYPIDDEDERMRRQRAKEMAEGVEVSLSSRFGVLSLNKNDSYHQVHTQVDYVHCLVPDLKEITTCSFYWGKIDRYEAEKLLEGKVEGTFLLRDSAQEEYLFSVSFRRYGRSLHARIEQWNYSFSFDSHDPSVFSSPTVTGLIEHYKDPSSCMFFEPLLTTPLHRNFPFDLQHLARSVICKQIKYDNVNALPLPKRLKVYCKEYHYKQRVRVRQLE